MINPAFKKDLYAILGIEKNASQEEIKKAYRRRAIQLHPDTNPDDKEGTAFKELNEAYSILSDPKQKRDYDLQRTSFQPSTPNPSYARRENRTSRTSFFASEIYEEILRNATNIHFDFDPTSIQNLIQRFMESLEREKTDQKFQQDKIRYDIEAKIQISFQEAFLGITKHLKINRDIKCSKCNGLKEIKTGLKKCRICEGSGYRGIGQQQKCSSCGGTGKRDRIVRCLDCNGKGTRSISDVVKIDITSGVWDNKKIRIVGKGHSKFGSTGDLFISIQIVDKDNFFRRKGLDVYCSIIVDKEINEKGGKKVIPTVLGQVTATIPAKSKNHVLRLKGLGFPDETNNKKGDQLVKILVSD